MWPGSSAPSPATTATSWTIWSKRFCSGSPHAVRRFLLQTAILDRLHGPLCEAVTGQPDGQARLAALERGNFFVVPLDDQRQWYRYHHLFADVLTAHLRAEQPEQVRRYTGAPAPGTSSRGWRRKFCGFGDLRNKAVEKCRFDWIFSLDLDQRCTAEVRDEVWPYGWRAPPRCLSGAAPQLHDGRWIRGSGWDPNFRQPQLFRKGACVTR